MKLLTVSLAFLIFSTSLFANAVSLPELPESNRIALEFEDSYKQALKVALRSKNLAYCDIRGEPEWNMRLHTFNVLSTSDFIRNEIYMFPGAQPLFIVRIRGKVLQTRRHRPHEIRRSDNSVLDFSFYTNSNFTEITDVQLVRYDLTETITNRGNLVNPDITPATLVKIAYDGPCFSVIP